jgi:hypothetical protein
VRYPDSGDSRILKVLKRPRGEPPTGSAWLTSETPTHFNYWRREVWAYDTGFADTVYGEAGIRAPKLEALKTREDGDVELWLEDVAGPSGFAFPIPRLGRFGYELGVAQARWAGRVPAVDEMPWLSRGWLRQYLTEDLAGTSVLLDWAFVGEGAIGEDPANLIVDSVTGGLMDAALLAEIVEAVTSGYIGGLADGGHRAAADDVRRAIATCAVVKYSWLGAHAVSTAIRGYLRTPSYDQDPPAETLKRITGLAELLGDWAAGVLGRG